MGRSHLSSVRELLRAHVAVESDAEAEVTDTAAPVVFYQHVVTLQVSVSNWCFDSTYCILITVQVSHTPYNITTHLAELRPVQLVGSEVVSQVSLNVIGHDQPQLSLHSVFLRRQEVDDVVVTELCVEEDLMLRLPGQELLHWEDFNCDRLKYPIFTGLLAESSAVHFSEASFSHQFIQMDGQKLRVVIEPV